MTTRPTIIFDLDGTLADTIRDLLPALNRTIATRGIDPVSTQQIGHLTGAGMKSMIEHAFALNNQALDAELLDELFAASLQDYEQNIAVETVFYPGVRASLQQFISEGWLTGVCTNKPVGLATKLLQELEADHLFCAITGGDSFEIRKPDPGHLVKTIEMAGGKPTRAIMVGDSENDILTAQNAGIPVVAVDFGYCEHPVENYSPDVVISAFEQLYNAAIRLVK